MINRHLHRFITFACALLLAMVVPRAGFGQILIVQSSTAEVYQQAVSGFHQTFTPSTSLPGVSSIQTEEILILDPTSPQTVQLVTQKNQTLQPNLIVAVGSLALKVVSSLAVPVIYLMVPEPGAIVRPHPGLIGIRMTVAPAAQLAAIKQTFPRRTRIGLLHNPAASGDLLTLSQGAAEGEGLIVVSIPATSDREAIMAVAEWGGDIDALLLTPDPSLISSTLLEALAQFSLEHRIPVVAFAPKYLEHGAAMVVFAAPEDMGRQAGRMARERLNQALSADTLVEFAAKTTILTNPRIIRKMGTPSVSSTTNPGRRSL